MNQSTYIAAALLAGFVLWLATQNRLSTYTAVLWGGGTGTTGGTTSGGSSVGAATAGAAVGSALGSILPDALAGALVL